MVIAHVSHDNSLSKLDQLSFIHLRELHLTSCPALSEIISIPNGIILVSEVMTDENLSNKRKLLSLATQNPVMTYQTTSMRTIADLESMTNTHIRSICSSDLVIDILHLRITITLIIRNSLVLTHLKQIQTIISCESIRFPTSMSLSLLKSYTGEGSRVAILRPKG